MRLSLQHSGKLLDSSDFSKFASATYSLFGPNSDSRRAGDARNITKPALYGM